MPKLTREETIIDIGLDGWYNPKVCITFKKGFLQEENGDIKVKLTKKQTTQFINALKSQRKRKNVK